MRVRFFCLPIILLATRFAGGDARPWAGPPANRVGIVCTTRGPIELPSLWGELAILRDPAPDGPGDAGFGFTSALSTDGSTLLIGYQNSKAIVYTRVGNAWTNQVELDDPNGPEAFGQAVAVSADGEVLAVGASLATPANGPISAGRVYLYERSGGTWLLQTQLENPGAEGGNVAFGASVALDNGGNVLAVGSTAPGKVYIFTRNAGNWVQTAELDSPQAFTVHFGNAVSLSGDGLYLAVGADETVVKHRFGKGRVYVFVSGGHPATWTLQATLRYPGRLRSPFFGNALAMTNDGARLIVGAPLAFQAGKRNYAYVYAQSAGRWRLESTIPSRYLGDLFGSSVAIDVHGTTALIGDSLRGNVAASRSLPGAGGVPCGRAYAFTRNGRKWVLSTEFVNPDTGAFLGQSVAVSGDGATAVVTAQASVPFDPDTGDPGPGITYIYQRSR